MSEVQITGFVPLLGLTQAIIAAGYPLRSVMQSDQVTQLWYTDSSVLSQVQAIVLSYDPMPMLRQPYIQQLQGIYASKIAAGYTYTDGHNYQLGPDALGSTGAFNLNSIAALALQALAGDPAAWPTGSFIRDAANNNVVYTPQQALDVARNAGIYVLRMRKNYWNLLSQINAATNSTQLAAINLNAGWS